MQELKDAKLMPAFMLSEYKLKMLKNNLEKSESELEKFKNSFSQNLFSEKDLLCNKRDELKNSLYRIRDSLSKLVLYAPISGKIEERKSLNCGDNIFIGEELIKLVPNTAKKFQALIKIPSDKAGLICEGMKVKLKIPAFPHYEYGYIEGKIETILPDIQYSGRNFTEYLAYVSLSKNYLRDKNNCMHKLKVGLGVNACIVTETDTIFSYILKKMEVK